jgi:hypothetical protein
MVCIFFGISVLNLKENTNGAYLKEFFGFMGCSSCLVTDEHR